MKKLIYILFAFHFCILTLNAQPSITWHRVYQQPIPGRDEYGYDVCSADNEDFYVVTTIPIGSVNKGRILKISPYGDTIWTRMIDTVVAFAVTPSGDLGCVVTGNAQFTLKVDSDGNVLWKKYYNNRNGEFYRIIKTYQNSFIASGSTGPNEAAIMNVDSNGNLIWLKKYIAGYRTLFYTICEAHNSGYAAAGYIFDSFYDTGYGIVNRVDESGELIWQKRYRLFGNHFDIMTIEKIPAGYLLSAVAYDTAINRGRLSIIRTDTSGNIYFTKVLADDTAKTIYWTRDLEIINPNKYIIAYPLADTGMSPDSLNAKITITDSVGNILKSKFFTGTDYTYFNKCHVINENSFLLVGNSNHLTLDFANVYIIRTDSNFYYPPLGKGNMKEQIPVEFRLYQNYPNPFNPTTTIKFDLPKEGFVTFKVYDVLGKELYSTIDYRTAGTYQITLDGSNFASGLYFYRLETGNFVETKKMVLIK